MTISAKLVVTEGISGTWFYHLSEDAPKPKQQTALCGARVMHTNMPREAWGTVTHIGERWCKKCQSIAELVP